MRNATNTCGWPEDFPCGCGILRGWRAVVSLCPNHIAVGYGRTAADAEADALAKLEKTK